MAREGSLEALVENTGGLSAPCAAGAAPRKRAVLQGAPYQACLDTPVGCLGVTDASEAILVAKLPREVPDLSLQPWSRCSPSQQCPTTPGSVLPLQSMVPVAADR